MTYFTDLLGNKQRADLAFYRCKLLCARVI